MPTGCGGSRCIRLESEPATEETSSAVSCVTWLRPIGASIAPSITDSAGRRLVLFTSAVARSRQTPNSFENRSHGFPYGAGLVQHLVPSRSEARENWAFFRRFQVNRWQRNSRNAA